MTEETPATHFETDRPDLPYGLACADHESLLAEGEPLSAEAGELEMDFIAQELTRIAAYRSRMNAADRLTQDVEEALLQRVDALASAATLCKGRSATHAFILVSFADHIIDTSIGFRGDLDLRRYQLGQRLLGCALRTLVEMGALQGHRPDLTDAFSTVRHAPQAGMATT